jgi:hypothetical protein
MNIKNIFGLVIVGLLLFSCDYQKQNKALNDDKSLAQEDLREGDELVYGVHPDSAARQTKNKYTAKPENEVRAQKIREKFENQ